MVSFAQAIPDARDIINDFNNDINVFWKRNENKLIYMDI